MGFDADGGARRGDAGRGRRARLSLAGGKKNWQQED
jgi:hypothetical protein